jgi:hypothetical protein
MLELGHMLDDLQAGKAPRQLHLSNQHVEKSKSAEYCTWDSNLPLHAPLCLLHSTIVVLRLIDATCCCPAGKVRLARAKEQSNPHANPIPIRHPCFWLPSFDGKSASAKTHKRKGGAEG